MSVPNYIVNVKDDVATVTTQTGVFTMDADKVNMLDGFCPEIAQGRVRLRKGSGTYAEFYTATHVFLNMTKGSGQRVYHLDGDPRNCRTSNLTVTSNVARGCSKPRSESLAVQKSKIYVGVAKILSRTGFPDAERDTPWRVSVPCGGNSKYVLGHYHTEKDAGLVLESFYNKTAIPTPSTANPR